MLPRAKCAVRQSMSILILTVLVLFGAFTLLEPRGTRATISLINGNWIVTGTNDFTNAAFTIDGNLYVNGTLNLHSSRITFNEDTGHKYRIIISAGNTLRLDGSTITVNTNAISPYLQFAIDVNGTLNAFAGSTLKFPGWIIAYNSGRVNVTNSRTTGFTSAEVNAFGFTDPDDNDDGPAISLRDTSEMYVIGGSIEKLYEHSSLDGGARKKVTLQNSAKMWVIDSFVAVDFKNSVLDHNTFSVEGPSSQLSIYNMTVDPEGDPADQLGAITVTSTGKAYIHRWLDVKATDAYDVAIAAARVQSQAMPAVTVATYPDNGGLTVPHPLVRWYLGKTTANFNLTGSDGTARIPLLTDTIDTSAMGSVTSAFSGNYRANTTYPKGATTYYGNTDFTFASYPASKWTDNNKNVVVVLATLINPRTPGATWATTTTVNFPVGLSTDLLITGKIALINTTLSFSQATESYIQIQSGGSLTLINSTVVSNHRLVIQVSNGLFNTTTGSKINLDGDLGEGTVASTSTGIITLRNSFLNGSVSGAGGTVTLRNVTMTGSNLAVTRGRANLYGVVFTKDANLTLTTDDGSLATVDVDLRNLTLSSAMASQLKFSGNQWVQLTNVTPLGSGNWWTSVVSGNAKVSRYAWLTIRAVDGTKAFLPGASVDILRLNPLTLTFSRVSAPLADDLYGGSSLAVPATTTAGPLIYRAVIEEASQAYHYMNNSYRLNASKVVGLQTFTPDGNPFSVPPMNGDTVVSLVFSSLTPDFRVTSIVFSGANGDFDFQPTGMTINIAATVRNDGSVDTSGVQITFYNFNVDANDDGVLDGPAADFYPFIIYQVNRNILANSQVVVTSPFTIPRSGTTPITISVVVDANNNITELKENNNILKRVIQPFPAPDLRVRTEDIAIDRSPVVGGTVIVNVTVSNIGTATAFGASVVLYNRTGSGPWTSAGSAAITVSAGSSSKATIPWLPLVAGSQDLRVIVYTANNSGFPDTNRDYNWTNNVAYRLGIQVATQPDLELRSSDFQNLNFVRGKPYVINVTIHNNGASPAIGVTISAYLGTLSPANLTGTVSGVVVPGNGQTVAQLTINAIQLTGTFTLRIVADPSNQIPETNENNNQVAVTLQVVAPSGAITLVQPDTSAIFEPGTSIIVEGYVRTLGGVPISSQNVTVVLRNIDNSPVATRTVQSDNNGHFVVGMDLPSDAKDGTWHIVATTNIQDIQDASASVTVQKNLPFWQRNLPIINLPLWMFLVVLALVIGAVGGITTYMKYIGVGHMVECGECGAFVPESSSACPKCGVEFEKSMAKCSNCHAWIPANVKNCPECGIQFTTGEVATNEYEDRQRGQYDAMVQRYREEAGRQMGRQLSDKEFQDWWRRQPSFVTFEEWVRQEEDMRKMGSKPCPRCGQPNAVTATVCHKCGSPMVEAPPPQQPPRTPPPGVVMGQMVQRPQQPPPPPPPGSGGAGQGGLFKRLTGGGPVVQKKVVKKTGETQESEKKDDIV